MKEQPVKYMKFLIFLKKLIPALIITNLIFISNAHAFLFFSDSDVETLKKTYIYRDDDITLDELIRTHQFFKDGKWDTETDENGNKCVIYTAKYDTKAVLSSLFKCIYKEDLDYLAEKIEDCGYSFVCKLTFTMERERFKNVFCEISTSEGDVLGRYNKLIHNTLNIKKGYLDNSNGTPAVIQTLCKNYSLADSSRFDGRSYNADSFTKKLRYIYLEYQFSKKINNLFISDLKISYDRDKYYTAYCLIEIEKIDFDKKNEDISITAKVDVYDCSKRDLERALFGYSEEEDKKNFLKNRCNIIYSIRQTLHIAKKNKYRIDYVTFLPEEKNTLGNVEIKTSWIGDKGKYILVLDGYFKSNGIDLSTADKSHFDFANSFVEKQNQKVNYFNNNDYNSIYKNLKEAYDFLKSVDIYKNKNFLTPVFVIKNPIGGKDYIQYVLYPFNFSDMDLSKDYLTKEDVKYLELASSSKDIIFLDKEIIENIFNFQKTTDNHKYYTCQNTVDNLKLYEGNLAKYIFKTINDVSLTDKLELIDANGNILTKKETKGNKEQFFGKYIQNNTNKLSITGLFSLGDDGKLYIDNYDLIKSNSTATATNVAVANNENITHNKIDRFQIVDVYTHETVLGLTNKLSFTNNYIIFFNTMTRGNKFLPINEICINIAEGEIAFRDGTPYFVVSDWQFDNHPAKGRSFPIGTKTATGWDITQQDVDKISKELNLYDLVKDSL